MSILLRHMLLGACLLTILAGCSGGQSYTYSDAREQKPGPGLLSGEDGVFTIYGGASESSQQLDSGDPQ